MIDGCGGSMCLALRFFAETTQKQIESSIQTVIAIENNYSIWREIIYTGLVGFSSQSLVGVESNVLKSVQIGFGPFSILTKFKQRYQHKSISDLDIICKMFYVLFFFFFFLFLSFSSVCVVVRGAVVEAWELLGGR